MFLKSLKLLNFRNYEQLELNFNSNITLFTGKNAQGKTNILEAIYLSCTGRSHRTQKDKEMIQWKFETGFIKTEVLKKDGIHVIEILLQQEGKKKIKVNGIVAARSGELMGHLNGVIFSPEDLKLVKEGPSERRRFMDIELSQVKPQYFYNLQQYNRVLSQRNNLLKEIMRKPSLKNSLFVWDEQLSDIGSRIIWQRKIFSDRLSKIACSIHHSISDGKENLQVKYQGNIDGNNLECIKINFLMQLEKNLSADMHKGSTSVGPHRDDMLLTINDIDVRSFGSQGQQRTTVLSMKLSELELMKEDIGEYPVLLLDDVMSELDSDRQRMLMEHICGIQTLITCTDIESILQITEKEKETYHVSNGKLKILS